MEITLPCKVFGKVLCILHGASERQTGNMYDSMHVQLVFSVSSYSFYAVLNLASSKFSTLNCSWL